MLTVRNLDVTFNVDNNTVHAVKGVSYDVNLGESLGIVGESGSGKSVSSLAIMGLLPPTATVKGDIIFKGQYLTQLSDADYRLVRGSQIGYIFQNSVSCA